MNLKTLVNGAALFIGLGLAAYSQLNGLGLRFSVESTAVDSPAEDEGVLPEVLNLKPGSIYDGDTPFPLITLGRGIKHHITLFAATLSAAAL